MEHCATNFPQTTKASNAQNDNFKLDVDTGMLLSSAVVTPDDQELEFLKVVKRTDPE